MEQQRLSSDLQAILLPDAADDTEAAVAGLAASLPEAQAAASAALQRCLRFTRGTGLPALIVVMDEQLSLYVARLQVSMPQGVVVMTM